MLQALIARQLLVALDLSSMADGTTRLWPWSLMLPHWPSRAAGPRRRRRSRCVV